MHCLSDGARETSEGEEIREHVVSVINRYGMQNKMLVPTHFIIPVVFVVQVPILGYIGRANEAIEFFLNILYKPH